MRLFVPAILERRKKASPWTLVPVEVAEAAASDAPVCFMMGDKMRPSVFRLHAGRIWEAIRANDGWWRPTDAERRGIGWTTDLGFMHPLASSDRRFVDDYAHSRKTGYEPRPEDVEAEAIKSVRRRAEMTLIVDGVYHSLSSGPIVSLTVSAFTSHLIWQAGLSKWSEPIDRIRVFGWNELELAKQVAGKLQKTIHFGGWPKPKVLIKPPAAAFDSAAGAVESAAAHALGRLRLIRMRDLPREGVDAYLELVGAYRARWPRADEQVRNSLGNGWLHEKDEIDFPPPGRLGQAVLALPPALTTPMDHEFASRHRIAVARIEATPFRPDPDHAPVSAQDADLFERLAP